MIAIAVHEEDREDHSIGFRNIGFARNRQEAYGKMMADIFGDIGDEPVPGAIKGDFCFEYDYTIDVLIDVFNINHIDGRRTYMFITEEEVNGRMD